MLEKKITVMCPRDNKKYIVYYTVFNNLCFPNGCDFMNGSTECENCNINVARYVNSHQDELSGPQELF